MESGIYMNKQIQWTEKNGIYCSDNRYEFSIFKKEDFWMLSYTDFWTNAPDSYFVNVKRGGDDFFAVGALKKYAEKVVEIKSTIQLDEK